MSFRSAQIDELEGGHTALHVACHQGHGEIIRELLERGANIDVLVSSHNFLIITVIFCPVKIIVITGVARGRKPTNQLLSWLSHHRQAYVIILTCIRILFI